MMAGNYLNPESLMPQDLVQNGTGAIFGMGPLSGYDQGLAQAYGLKALNQGLQSGDIANQEAQIGLQEKIKDLPLLAQQRQQKTNEAGLQNDLYNSGLMKQQAISKIGAGMSEDEIKNISARAANLNEQGQFFLRLAAENPNPLDQKATDYWKAEGRKYKVDLPDLSQETLAAVKQHAYGYLQNRDYIQHMAELGMQLGSKEKIATMENQTSRDNTTAQIQGRLDVANMTDTTKRYLANTADNLIGTILKDTNGDLSPRDLSLVQMALEQKYQATQLPTDLQTSMFIPGNDQQAKLKALHDQWMERMLKTLGVNTANEDTNSTKSNTSKPKENEAEVLQQARDAIKKNPAVADAVKKRLKDRWGIDPSKL